MNPLLHYVLFGDTEYHETRDPNAVFDSSYYSQMNPGVAKSGMSALEHYWLFGWKESLPENPNGNPNRNPSPFVSTRDYFEIHEDVRIASYTLPSANPVQHLLEFGIIEGRATHNIQQSNNIAKFTKIITPDSDPQEISNLQKGMEKDGYKLKLTNGSFEVSQTIFTDDRGEFNPFKPIEDVVIALTIFAGVAIKAYNLTNTAGEFVGESVYELLYGDDFDVSTITGISIFPEDTPLTDVTSISYGDPSLADLLGGTRAFPGQTESEIAVEIFKPPVIDGVEDFTIFPEEGIFLPSPTGFPKRDETLEDLLDGPFIFPEVQETSQGFYTIETDPFAAVDTNIDIDKGTVRELKVAEIVGGFKVVTPGRPKVDLPVRARNNPNIGLQIDVVGPNNELILVGGANKAGNLKQLTDRTRTLKRVADSYGVKAQAYFADNTPQAAIDTAIKELGTNNVFTFQDVTSQNTSRLPQLKIIKNKIKF